MVINYTKILYVILFLFAINFMNLSGYIFIIMSLIFLFNLGYRRKFALTPMFLMVIFFSMSYFIIYIMNFGITFKYIVYFLLGPIISFFLGSQLVNDTDLEKSKTNIYYIVMTVSVGMFLHGFLNMIGTIIKYGEFNTTRTVIDFWRGDLVSATGQGMFFTMIVSVGIAFIIGRKKFDYVKIFIILAIFFSVYSTLELANRTLLVILAVVWLATIILNSFISKWEISKLIKVFVAIFSLCVLVMVILKCDIFEIRTYIESSPLMLRLEDSGEFMKTSRTDIIKDFFTQWLSYPFGGYQILMLDKFVWTHNLWLDIYGATGVIPFIIFIIYTLMFVKDTFNFTRDKRVDKFIRLLVFSFYFGVLLNFCVEPILENNPYFFMVFIMVNGAVNSYLYKRKCGDKV